MEKKGQHYDETFQRDAVDHLIRSGKSIRQVSRDLGISDHTLRNWKSKFLAEKDSPQKQTLEERIAFLERENRELMEERDILKKSVAIFLKPRK